MQMCILIFMQQEVLCISWTANRHWMCVCNSNIQNKDAIILRVDVTLEEPEVGDMGQAENRERREEVKWWIRVLIKNKGWS